MWGTLVSMVLYFRYCCASVSKLVSPNKPNRPRRQAGGTMPVREGGQLRYQIGSKDASQRQPDPRGKRRSFMFRAPVVAIGARLNLCRGAG
jgi:hypothetical protein